MTVSISSERCWSTIGVAGDRSCPELPACVHCHNCEVYSAAALNLLDLPLSKEYIQESTGRLARNGEVRKRMDSVFAFRIGQEWLAFPTRALKEVSEPAKIHSVPNSPSKTLIGLANIGGELVICISLQRLMGIEAAAGAGPEQRRMLIVDRAQDRFAIPVDEVHGLIDFDPVEMRPVPATVARTAAFIVGLIPWKGKTVGCLSDEWVCSELTRSLT